MSIPIPQSILNSPSRIARRVAELYQLPLEAQHSPTVREFLAGMTEVPQRILTRYGDGETIADTFPPRELSINMVRMSTGMMSTIYTRRVFTDRMDHPVSIFREMLLYAFEAKPRPISYGITRYSVPDFFRYIYQDIILREIGIDPDEPDAFWNYAADMQDWLLDQDPREGKRNTPRRHLRRRLQHLFDRPHRSVLAIFQDTEIPSELPYLLYKLLERDDDEGYTEGRLQDFRTVRSDFNCLLEYLYTRRHRDDPEAIAHLQDRLQCPSLVEDFSEISVRMPRTPSEKTLLARQAREEAAAVAKSNKLLAREQARKEKEELKKSKSQSRNANRQAKIIAKRLEQFRTKKPRLPTVLGLLKDKLITLEDLNAEQLAMVQRYEETLRPPADQSASVQMDQPTENLGKQVAESLRTLPTQKLGSEPDGAREQLPNSSATETSASTKAVKSKRRANKKIQSKQDAEADTQSALDLLDSL